MFEILLWAVPVVCGLAVFFAYSTSRDSFHPLVFICPMFAALYWWMPWQEWRSEEIYRFLDEPQLEYVQGLNLLGVLAFTGGCLLAGSRQNRLLAIRFSFYPRTLLRLRLAAYALGGIGIIAWIYTIDYVGGFSAAFGRSYGGGYAATGYIRDAPFLLLPAILLLLPSLLRGRVNGGHLFAAVLFAIPWATQGLLGARRGPTFLIVVIIATGWCLFRGWRPPLAIGTIGFGTLGYLVLFLVLNRTEIYLGSELDFRYDVSSRFTSAGGDNEYIYGAGAILHAEEVGRVYWGKRYLAQILVRPVPRQWWPNKYADFGVPELEVNAGTGGVEFRNTIGWAGTVGAAPGIVADLWLEFRWLMLPALLGMGSFYGFCWRRAVTQGGGWVFQYVILVSLSLYLVMQTMEAVIFRFLILSVPMWIAWRWANHQREHSPVLNGVPGPAQHFGVQSARWIPIRNDPK